MTWWCQSPKSQGNLTIALVSLRSLSLRRAPCPGGSATCNALFVNISVGTEATPRREVWGRQSHGNGKATSAVCCVIAAAYPSLHSTRTLVLTWAQLSDLRSLTSGMWRYFEALFGHWVWVFTYFAAKNTSAAGYRALPSFTGHIT